MATLEGRTAELFSVGPIAALAAGLLCGRLPTATDPSKTIPVRAFGVACTDRATGAGGVAVCLE